jgi:hypothetical protein
MTAGQRAGSGVSVLPLYMLSLSKLFLFQNEIHGGLI